MMTSVSPLGTCATFGHTPNIIHAPAFGIISMELQRNLHNNHAPAFAMNNIYGIAEKSPQQPCCPLSRAHKLTNALST
jgi:hypothetical protein